MWATCDVGLVVSRQGGSGAAVDTECTTMTFDTTNYTDPSSPTPGQIDLYIGKKSSGTKPKPANVNTARSPSQKSPEHQKHRVKFPESSPAATDIPPAPDPSVITPQQGKENTAEEDSTEKLDSNIFSDNSYRTVYIVVWYVYCCSKVIQMWGTQSDGG